MPLYKTFDTFRRYWRQLRLITIRDGWKKMAFMKRHNYLALLDQI